MKALDDHTRPMGYGAFVVIYSIVDGHLCLLLGQRNGNTVSYPYWLELAGGTVEATEQWRRALAREVEEETGIITHPDKIVPFARYRRPDQPQALLRAATLQVDSLGVSRSEEWIGSLWADAPQVRQLQDMILPAHLRIIGDVLEEMGVSLTTNPVRTTAWIRDE